MELLPLEVLYQVVVHLSPTDYGALASTCVYYADVLANNPDYWVTQHRQQYGHILYQSTPRASLQYLTNLPRAELIKLAIDYHNEEMWARIVVDYAVSFNDKPHVGIDVMRYGTADMLMRIWKTTSNVLTAQLHENAGAGICQQIMDPSGYSHDQHLLADNAEGVIPYFHRSRMSTFGHRHNLMLAAVHADAPRCAHMTRTMLGIEYDISCYMLAVRRRSTRILAAFPPPVCALLEVVNRYMDPSISEHFRASTYFNQHMAALLNPATLYSSYQEMHASHPSRMLWTECIVRAVMPYLKFTDEIYIGHLRQVSYQIRSWLATTKLYIDNITLSPAIVQAMHGICKDKKYSVLQRAYIIHILNRLDHPVTIPFDLHNKSQHIRHQTITTADSYVLVKGNNKRYYLVPPRTTFRNDMAIRKVTVLGITQCTKRIQRLLDKLD